MDATFELFDHTADIGIRARAPTMSGLVAPAVDGLYAVIGALATHGGAEPMRWEQTGDDAVVLLRDYMAELLALFEDKQRVATEHQVEAFGEGRLSVTAQTRAIDEDRSVWSREVKAVTYHGLAIVEVSGGYEATIIVDI